ncbi:MAG: hypothetical protein ACD_40C00190G0006 [uncultured bacterium]|nr:MAG: hypothetical protein ACD_40C00190G0006 [uncultured bacterium]KKU26487.1 MAG: hypothetical protein UX37_C0002G0053 [Microgenomates group bacterium GW2011_GWA2_46_16]
MTKTRKIVAIGGGTGTFTLLMGLRVYNDLDVTAIVTMADDGGSNKVLRDEFGLLPTSGIRQSIIALAKDTTLLRQLFSYRYYHGTGISGMTFGNLFMAAVADILGSQKEAIQETCKLLGVKGHVLPVSYENTSLVATYKDGTEVLGEHCIDLSNPKVAKQRIINLRTIPKITLDQDAAAAIRQADLIILGPGDLYTNTIANLVVKGIREAIEESYAKVIFVMNLMSRLGETYRYLASDFLADLSQYLNSDRLGHIILNSDLSLTPTVLKKYSAEGSSLVEDDLESTWHRAKITRTKLLSHHAPPKEKGDKLERSMVRHDPHLLAKAIYGL